RSTIRNGGMNGIGNCRSISINDRAASMLIRISRCSLFCLMASSLFACFWECYAECRPAAELTFQLNCTIVPVYDAADDIESESRAVLAACPRLIDFIKSFEDTFLMFRKYTGSGIADFYDLEPPSIPDPDCYIITF